ncbi:hypothetical protein OG21DRAFT_1489555 [Imleria badia]|nr:hypothetical protein OG21DRAFT_1489555 [Imleria badia]
MTEPITELLMPKAPLIQMSGDVILLDIDDVVPGWETYMFTLDAIHPGEKKIILRIKHRTVDNQSVEVQTENTIAPCEMLASAASQTDSHEALTVPIKEDPGIVLKLQLPNLVKLEDEEIPLDITVAQSSHVICSSVVAYPIAPSLQDI